MWPREPFLVHESNFVRMPYDATNKPVFVRQKSGALTTGLRVLLIMITITRSHSNAL